jgi:hypothetical protein
MSQRIAARNASTIRPMAASTLAIASDPLADVAVIHTVRAVYARGLRVVLPPGYRARVEAR